MRQKQYKKTESSKRTILNAAHRLIVEKGFEKTSIKDIVRESGLSVGSFYHHFRSKDDMLNEAFLKFDDQLTEETLARYDKMDSLGAIKAVLLDQTVYTETIGSNLMSEYYRALLQNKNRGAISPQRTYYMAVESYVKKAQSLGLLGRKHNSASITEYLIKNVRGTLLDWCLHNGKYSVTERVKSELESYLLLFA